jgi:hypothetical protein
MSPLRTGTCGVTGALCACVLLTAGCGSSAQKRQVRELENQGVLASTTPLGQRLISQAEVTGASDEHAAQTFLQLWSLLQFQSWDQAAALFAPGLRQTIGDGLLLQTLESNVVVWQGTKPKIVSATAKSDDTAVIRFFARNEVGTVVPTSITFERGSGSWLVSYFPLLDVALQRTAQIRAQGQIEPLATKPSPEAVRQGDSAFVLQSVYQERRLREKRAAKSR